MKMKLIAGLLTTTALAFAGATQSAYAASATVQVDANDIGGQVTGANGPEAGVWVIAESRSELATRFIKIVVTDDQGRFVIPDLPKATYKVWVRGYGLIDSKAVDAAPGKLVDLKAVPAPDKAAAAQYYPASYWYALIGTPAESEFPGTGPKGNGISPKLTTPQHWAALQKNCIACHQWGGPATRNMPDMGNNVEAWWERIAKVRAPNDPTMGNHSANVASGMLNGVSQFGKQRALETFAAWTDKIRNGALPTETPPRPKGKERNVVISVWDWGTGNFTHDVISTDRRDPSKNAKGAIYGTDLWNSKVLELIPGTMETKQVPIPATFPPARKTDLEAKLGPQLHNPMLDHKGRVWMTDLQSTKSDNGFCTDEKNNKFAKVFPTATDHTIHIYDPKAKTMVGVPSCFGSHHLAFGYDKNDTLYFSGDTNVLGWIDTKVYDDTKDITKAMGWCPMVLDTNGDGKMEQDRTKWNQTAVVTFGGGEHDAGQTAADEKKLDPKKDTRISGFLYGVNTTPNDKEESVWFARYAPDVPSGIIRMTKGNNAPETCKVEYYSPPKLKDGTYAAFATRGIDVDSKGMVWVSHGSGHISKFDRSKCKVLNGPTAMGDQCAEGWTVYEAPGPKIQDGKTGADYNYLVWIDLHDTFGMGKDTPFIPGSNSDSMVAVQPGGDMMVMRVPYPMGYFPRGVDGRIDDPTTGWKGKGLWSNFATVPVDHQEDGPGDTSKVVHFQMRPDPLAH
jgi:hypothetical protein